MATQFTTGTSPQTGSGQVWVENSNGEWEIANVTAPGVVRRVFTNADDASSFTPSPGAILTDVICVGPGGGGGGCAASTGRELCAGGGGAGARARSLLTPADIGASQTLTIPAGASGGAAGANNGSDAGDTSFGSLVVADGGSGGTHADSGDGGIAGVGGLVANCTGDEKYPGENGGRGIWYDFTDLYLYGDALGGSTPWGKGGDSNSIGAGGAGSNAGAGQGYGAGGGGARGHDTASTFSGGAGSEGLIIVTEYIRQSVLSPIAYDSNGNEILDLRNGEVASAVNYVQIGNAATGSGPTISAVGDDTDIGLTLKTKGDDDVLVDLATAANGAYPSLNVYSAASDGSSAVINVGNLSASPADTDFVGFLQYRGYNSAAETVTYAKIYGQAVDVTDATEDGRMVHQCLVGGSNTTILHVDGSGISFDVGTNYMDDYEEGTWTPTIEGSTTNPTVTYDVQTGNYTKVGNICTASFSVDLATYSGGSGFLWLNGLPFNSAGDQNVYGVAFTFVQNLDWGTGDTMICAHVENNDNFFYWYGQTNNSGANIVSVGDASASTTMAGTVTYRTA